MNWLRPLGFPTHQANTRHTREIWLTALISSLLIGLLVGLQLLQPLEQWSYGWLFRRRNLAAWEPHILLVQSPNPIARSELTELLNRLNYVQPNTVVLDLDLSQSHPADPDLAIAMQQHGHVVLRASAANPKQLEWPNPTLAPMAQAIGHDYLPTDPDGSIRQIPAWLAESPALGLAAMPSTVAQRSRLPAQLWLNWRGPNSTIPQQELQDLLSNRLPIEPLRDHIILVSETPQTVNGMAPFARTGPIASSYFHATLIDNLARNNLLTPLGGRQWWMGLLLSNLLWSICLARIESQQRLYRTAVLLIGLLGLAILILRYGYWIPIASALLLYGLTSFGHLMLQNLTLERKNQQLRYLANVDELTQVANRRAFEQYLQQEWQRGMRDSQSLSLILCDVDYFKRFNDYYGHVAGDECLYTIAQVMDNTLKRPTDLVARYGGEEFAIVLPNTNLGGAETLAINLISQVRRQLLPHANSPISHYVTLTIGIVSGMPAKHGHWQNFLAQADQALYQAKREGRDRIVARPLETAGESPIIDPMTELNQLQDDRSVGDDYA